jgi:hypothetical protein
VAACVVAALIATLTTTKVLSEHPAAPISTAPPPSSTVVQLADARIWLPPGWHATVSSRGPSDKFPYADAGTQSITWCLGPAAKAGRCQVWLERAVQEPVHGNLDGRFDPTVAPGTPHSYLQLCRDPGSSGGYGWTLLDAALRDFGGRTAYYGAFDFQCDNRPEQHLTQYLVPAGPAFDLYATSTDTALQATMAEIAQRSALPKQTSAVPYYDHGYVRSLKSVAGHIELTIERVMVGPSGPIEAEPRTTRYIVPAGTWSNQNLHPTAVGQLVTVETDGTIVFEVERVPPH